MLVDAKDTTDAHGIEPALMDQASNGLRMDPEPACDLTDAVETLGLWFERGHS